MNWKTEFHELRLTYINNGGDNYDKCKVHIYSGLTPLFKKLFLINSI